MAIGALASCIVAFPAQGGVGEGEVAELGDDVALDVAIDVADVDHVVIALGADGERVVAKGGGGLRDTSCT
jgi:hypothetical protein